MMGNTKLRSERGMVSILVTMIMMIVISLIIIGISQVTRSNRREQLDQQLSTQAYYAAESGLNQATKFFATNPAVKLNTNGRCTDFIVGAGATGLQQVLGVGNVLNGTANVSYTCLMVNSTPTSLQKSPLTQDSNTVWQVQDSAGLAFSQLEFKWAPNASTQFTGGSPSDCTPVNANCCPLATNFATYGTWKCAFGILRADIVDTHGTVSSAALETPAKTIYMVPTYSASGVTTVQTMTPPSTAVGQVVNVLCSATICDLKLAPTVASSEYYVRLTMIYQDSSSVQLLGTDSSGVAKFAGGQAVIDVTGKAQDQLRRVQARIPLNVGNNAIPYYALQSTTTLCKQMTVGATTTTTDNCP